MTVGSLKYQSKIKKKTKNKDFFFAKSAHLGLELLIFCCKNFFTLKKKIRPIEG